MSDTLDIDEVETFRDTVNNRKRDTNKDAGVNDRLRSTVDRIERLEVEKANLTSDIRDIYTEAKSAGLDPKVLRQLISIRKKDADEVETQMSLLDVYKHALGM